MAYSRYYRSRLLPHEKVAYDAFVDGLARRKDKIKIPYITSSELDRVFAAIDYDYPDIFYMDFMSGFTYRTIKGISVTIDMPYLMSFEESVRTKRKIDAEAKAIADVARKLPPEEAEAYLHDTLVRRCEYSENDRVPLNAHNLVGPFLEGKCVCEGYSKAFQYLADMIKLPCIFVVGSLLDNSDGDDSLHAWNIVRLDGVTYHVDVTHDRMLDGKFCSRAYFNLSTAQICRTRTLDPTFPLPHCPINSTSIPVISSTTSLLEHLRREAARHIAYSEFRVTKRFTGKELMKIIESRLEPRDYGWYSKITLYEVHGYYMLIKW